MPDFALFPWSGRRITDANGDIAASAKLKVYDPGTQDERDFYTDTALTTEISWPITCDANGLVPKCYMPTGLYDLDITESDDTTIASYTNLPGALDTSSFATGSGTSTSEVESTALSGSEVTGDLGKTINIDTSGGDVTRTLPSAADAGDGGM